MSQQDFRFWLMVALAASIAAVAWMFVGGLVTYAPGSVSAGEMQNIYLERMLLYGGASVVLQVIAIGVVYRCWREGGSSGKN